MVNTLGVIVYLVCLVLFKRTSRATCASEFLSSLVLRELGKQQVIKFPSLGSGSRLLVLEKCQHIYLLQQYILPFLAVVCYRALCAAQHATEVIQYRHKVQTKFAHICHQYLSRPILTIRGTKLLTVDISIVSVEHPVGNERPYICNDARYTRYRTQRDLPRDVRGPFPAIPKMPHR